MLALMEHIIDRSKIENSNGVEDDRSNDFAMEEGSVRVDETAVDDKEMVLVAGEEKVDHEQELLLPDEDEDRSMGFHQARCVIS